MGTRRTAFRSFLLALLLVLALVEGRPARAQNGAFTVLDNGQNVDRACTGADTIEIDGNDNKVRLTGTCAAIKVQGNQNQVEAEGVGVIQALGNRNQVLWQRGAGGKPPRIQNLGKGNVVKKAAQASPAERAKPAPAAEAAPPTQPAAGKPPAAPLKRMDPISCGKTQTVRVENALIETDGDAIDAHGSCVVIVVGSRIVASGAAIDVHGNGSVQISDSQIEGRRAAVDIHGSGSVKAAQTRFAGPKDIHGGGQFVDGGGNTWR